MLKQLFFATSLFVLLSPSTIHAQAGFFMTQPCGGSPGILLALSDGRALLGTRTHCTCPGDYEYRWQGVACANVLGSAGFAGDVLVGLQSRPNSCGGIYALTRSGHLLLGSENGCFNALLGGNTVAASAGRPNELLIGFGAPNEGGGELYALGELGSVFNLRVQNSFVEVYYAGQVPGMGPTNVMPSSWGAMKLSFR